MCGVKGAQGASGSNPAADLAMQRALYGDPSKRPGIATGAYTLPSLGLAPPAAAAVLSQGPLQVGTDVSGVPMPTPRPEQPQGADPMLAAGQAQRFRPATGESYTPEADPMLSAGQAQRFRPAGVDQMSVSGQAMRFPPSRPQGAQTIVASGPGATPLPRPDPRGGSVTLGAGIGSRVQLPDGRMGVIAAPGLAIADGDNSGRYVGLGGGGFNPLSAIFGG